MRKVIKKLFKRKRIGKKIEKGLARRRAAEKRFRLYGLSAILVSFVFLTVLILNIVTNGYSAFLQTQIKLPISFTEEAVKKKSYRKLVRESVRSLFPEATSRSEKRRVGALLSKSASYKLRKIAEENPQYTGKTVEVWLTASTHVDMFMKGNISTNSLQKTRKLKNNQIKWVEELQEKGLVRKAFNIAFLTSGDSREPESAGVLGSIVGSLFVVISCMLLAFPLGVMTAIYLEEFAPKNKLTEFIEVNINNLAAVPSIVFGLLGLAIYLQFFGLPRSAPLAGGLTLALMALPIIVIATRTSIRAIPQAIRDGATALGASKMQTTMHHVLPLATPGIMTGAILSVARVLGETAPLLMIGMVAFIVDVPSSFTQASTALPIQIYLWSDSAEMGFVEKTSAAIMVLLLFLVTANMLAVYLRKKFEIRW